MSDTPQGPGWWQASDGRWYPPESHPGAAPTAQYPPQTGTAPPASTSRKGRGCLIGGLAGFGVLSLLVVAAVVIVIVAVARNADNDDGYPFDGTRANPAVEDVKVTSCEAGTPPSNHPQATGEILNHSSKESSYAFVVSFEVDGRRVAQGAVFQNNVSPDQTSNWETEGSQASTAASVTCKIVDVVRVAS